MSRYIHPAASSSSAAKNTQPRNAKSTRSPYLLQTYKPHPASSGLTDPFTPSTALALPLRFRRRAHLDVDRRRRPHGGGTRTRVYAVLAQRPERIARVERCPAARREAATARTLRRERGRVLGLGGGIP